MSKLLKQQARDFFKKTKSIRCPAFPKEKISLNSKGLNHIFYKGARSGRSKNDITIRIKLLPSAIELLQKMPLPQEEDNYKYRGKSFKFWAFEGIINNRRIKVIVRQIGNGNKHFWSVIPSWRRTRFSRQNFKRRLNKQ